MLSNLYLQPRYFSKASTFFFPGHLHTDVPSIPHIIYDIAQTKLFSSKLFSLLVDILTCVNNSIMI